MQRGRVATVLVESIDDFLRDPEASSFSKRDNQRNIEQLSRVVEDGALSDVGWQEYVYHALLTDVFLEEDDPCYDAFVHVYEALALSPALFPLNEDLSVLEAHRRLVRDLEFLPVLRERELSFAKAQRIVSDRRRNGYAFVGMGDQCLYFSAFGPEPVSREELRVHGNVRAYGEQSYIEASRRLQPIDGSASRASEHLGLYFDEYTQSLGGLRDAFFAPSAQLIPRDKN